MNLRLDARLATALQKESTRTGVSQQVIVRTAIEQFLTERALRSDRQRAIDAGLVTVGSSYRRITGTVGVPADSSIENALARVRAGA